MSKSGQAPDGDFPWSFPVVVAQLPEAGLHQVLEASATQRQLLADAAGVARDVAGQDALVPLEASGLHAAKAGTSSGARQSELGHTSSANFERRQHDSARLPAKRGEHGIPTVGVCVAGATPPVDIPAPEIIEPIWNSSPNQSAQQGQVQVHFVFGEGSPPCVRARTQHRGVAQRVGKEQQAQTAHGLRGRQLVRRRG